MNMNKRKKNNNQVWKQTKNKRKENLQLYRNKCYTSHQWNNQIEKIKAYIIIVNALYKQIWICILNSMYTQ